MYSLFLLTLQLVSWTISPLSHYCMNTSCPRFQWMMLKKCEVRKVALFTVGGTHPVHSLHLKCKHMFLHYFKIIYFGLILVLTPTECDINYHHNFRVFNGQHIYYDSLPDIIQVGEHQFIEWKLIDIWISMMLLAWTSATNCARMFNMSIANDDLPAWQFNLSLTTKHVFDGFTILCLLEDCVSQKRTLVIPHGGAARDRFTEFVCLRNKRFWLCSQPELFHHCKKCTWTYKGTCSNLFDLGKLLMEMKILYAKFLLLWLMGSQSAIPAVGFQPAKSH